MEHAIRALGWATTAFWILVIGFSGTVVYSATQVGIEPGEPQEPFVSNGTVTTSVPFTINNMGFYDISNLAITTYITDKNGIALSNSTTPPTTIPRDKKVPIPLEISINLNNIPGNTLTCMLTNDTVLNIEMQVALTYAHAIPLKISLNTTMPWGAPLYNLTIDGISIVSANQVDVSLSFENHAFFSLDGTIDLELWNSASAIGSSITGISVPPGSSYDIPIPVTITGNPLDVTEVHLRINTSLFSYGPVVITI